VLFQIPGWVAVAVAAEAAALWLDVPPRGAWGASGRPVRVLAVDGLGLRVAAVPADEIK
jgi:hypothetical protein